MNGVRLKNSWDISKKKLQESTEINAYTRYWSTSYPRTSLSCSMYDVDGNGHIDLIEMTKIVKSIYNMMGPNQVRQRVSSRAIEGQAGERHPNPCTILIVGEVSSRHDICQSYSLVYLHLRAKVVKRGHFVLPAGGHGYVRVAGGQGGRDLQGEWVENAVPEVPERWKGWDWVLFIYNVCRYTKSNCFWLGSMWKWKLKTLQNGYQFKELLLLIPLQKGYQFKKAA